MRRNMFGEAYCHTSEELQNEFSERGVDPAECFADVFADDDIPGDYIAEVKLNESGEVVAYIEKAKGREATKNMLHVAGIPLQAINFI